MDLEALVGAAGPYRQSLERFLATGSHPELDHPFRDGQTPERSPNRCCRSCRTPGRGFATPTSPNAERFVAHKLIDTDGEVVQQQVESWLSAPPAPR